jgi:hypothetical protein
MQNKTEQRATLTLPFIIPPKIQLNGAPSSQTNSSKLVNSRDNEANLFSASLWQ